MISLLIVMLRETLIQFIQIFPQLSGLRLDHLSDIWYFRTAALRFTKCYN